MRNPSELKNVVLRAVPKSRLNKVEKKYLDKLDLEIEKSSNSLARIESKRITIENEVGKEVLAKFESLLNEISILKKEKSRLVNLIESNTLKPESVKLKMSQLEKVKKEISKKVKEKNEIDPKKAPKKVVITAKAVENKIDAKMKEPSRLSVLNKKKNKLITELKEEASELRPKTSWRLQKLQEVSCEIRQILREKKSRLK